MTTARGALVRRAFDEATRVVRSRRIAARAPAGGSAR